MDSWLKPQIPVETKMYSSVSNTKIVFYLFTVNFSEHRNTLCSCPEACYETQYKPTISQMAFPSNGVAMTLYLRGDMDIISTGFTEAVA